jgi:hypothetical protein
VRVAAVDGRQDARDLRHEGSLTELRKACHLGDISIFLRHMFCIDLTE